MNISTGKIPAHGSVSPVYLIFLEDTIKIRGLQMTTISHCCFINLSYCWVCFLFGGVNVE